MICVTLYDTMFSHNKSAGSLELYNEELVYSRDIQPIAIYTDFSTHLIKQHKSKHVYNIAWIIESPEYSRCDNLDMFDIILTHDENILNTHKNSVLFPIGGCWVDIKPKEYIKNKYVSIIASAKSHTNGQKLRHDIIKQFELDVYGGGYRYIENKSEALSEYSFSVVIENCKSKYYFSEKLIDCFISKTVPIYFGAEVLPECFDERGLIRFNDIESFKVLYDNGFDYADFLPYIQHNFNAALNYTIPEDRLVKFIKELRIFDGH